MLEIAVQMTRRYRAGQWSEQTDRVVQEAPLQIEIGYGLRGGRQKDTLAVTLRTPGQDVALATGLLFAEGVIGKAAHVMQVAQQHADHILLHLHPDVKVDLEHMERRFSATASCGMCGKAHIAGLAALPCYYPPTPTPWLPVPVLLQLQEKLRSAQTFFRQTGGIHAAGLFSGEGRLLLSCEDVGRHNALDKVVGAALQEKMLPLRHHIILLSGRIGFELVQKAAMTGLPVLAAVGAPTSMAIELAQTYGITLIGFLRDQQFNVYTGHERIAR